MITNTVSTFSGVLSMMAVDNYPYISFRVLGAFHLLLGLLFIVEGAVSTGLMTAYAMIDLNPLNLPILSNRSLIWTTNISPIPFGIMVSRILVKTKNHCFCDISKAGIPLVRATLTVEPADVYYMLCLLAYRWCRPIDIAYSKHRPVPLLELLELGYHIHDL